MGLMRRINRGVKVYAADSPAAIEATVKAIAAKT